MYTTCKWFGLSASLLCLILVVSQVRAEAPHQQIGTETAQPLSLPQDEGSSSSVISKRAVPNYSFGIGKKSDTTNTNEISLQADNGRQETDAEQQDDEDDRVLPPVADMWAEAAALRQQEENAALQDAEDVEAEDELEHLMKRAVPNYQFGLGKRAVPSYQFGLGKRASPRYEFGLGRRSSPYAFGKIVQMIHVEKFITSVLKLKYFITQELESAPQRAVTLESAEEHHPAISSVSVMPELHPRIVSLADM